MSDPGWLLQSSSCVLVIFFTEDVADGVDGVTEDGGKDDDDNANSLENSVSQATSSGLFTNSFISSSPLPSTEDIIFILIQISRKRLKKASPGPWDLSWDSNPESLDA